MFSEPGGIKAEVVVCLTIAATIGRFSVEFVQVAPVFGMYLYEAPKNNTGYLYRAAIDGPVELLAYIEKTIDSGGCGCKSCPTQ